MDFTLILDALAMRRHIADRLLTKNHQRLRKIHTVYALPILPAVIRYQDALWSMSKTMPSQVPTAHSLD